MDFPNAMMEALYAEGPYPENAEKLMLFGQFVGSWDVEVINYPGDGSKLVVPGEWHFGWVLEGRAIQDVWIAPKRNLRGTPGHEKGEYGATLRFFDPAIDAWRSTWIGPYRRIVRPFIARPVGEEIVLEGSFSEGELTRWIFSKITSASFHWRNVVSIGGGGHWQLKQEMFVTRRQ